jgi:hypothetical protein
VSVGARQFIRFAFPPFPHIRREDSSAGAGSGQGRALCADSSETLDGEGDCIRWSARKRGPGWWCAGAVRGNPAARSDHPGNFGGDGVRGFGSWKLPPAGATLAEMPNAKCDGEGRRKCPLRVLMDAGVVIHSEFAEYAVKEMSESPVRWSDGSAIRISGLKRKQPDEDEDYRKQKETLFTIGRLIREQNIEAYTYSEINVEHLRGRALVQEFNALQDCALHKCEPPIERSRFRRTSDFMDFFAKGGKKDRDLGHEGQANQIAFFEWLCTL